MATKSKIPAESDYDEVHVKPMVKSEDTAKFDPNSAASAESEVDPSLRTHTKPIRVDVDLVLVPVTITDPMNRLVTGLEKENSFFWITERSRRSSTFPVRTRRFRWA